MKRNLSFVLAVVMLASFRAMSIADESTPPTDATVSFKECFDAAKEGCTFDGGTYICCFFYDGRCSFTCKFSDAPCEAGGCIPEESSISMIPLEFDTTSQDTDVIPIGGGSYLIIDGDGSSIAYATTSGGRMTLTTLMGPNPQHVITDGVSEIGAVFDAWASVEPARLGSGDDE